MCDCTNLLHFKETAESTDIGLLQFSGSIHNSGTSASSDSVVISLPQTSENGDVALLEEVVLSGVRDTLLSDHQVWLEGSDLVTDLLDVRLLLLQDLAEIALVHDLDVGLRLSFLVLKVAVQQQDPGVLNLSLHFGMCDILVEHNSLQYLRIFNSSTRNLFDLGISLDINFLFDKMLFFIEEVFPKHINKISQDLKLQLYFK